MKARIRRVYLSYSSSPLPPASPPGQLNKGCCRKGTQPYCRAPAHTAAPHCVLLFQCTSLSNLAWLPVHSTDFNSSNVFSTTNRKLRGPRDPAEGFEGHNCGPQESQPLTEPWDNSLLTCVSLWPHVPLFPLSSPVLDPWQYCFQLHCLGDLVLEQNQSLLPCPLLC